MRTSDTAEKERRRLEEKLKISIRTTDLSDVFFEEVHRGDVIADSQTIIGESTG